MIMAVKKYSIPIKTLINSDKPAGKIQEFTEREDTEKNTNDKHFL